MVGPKGVINAAGAAVAAGDENEEGHSLICNVHTVIALTRLSSVNACFVWAPLVDR